MVKTLFVVFDLIEGVGDVVSGIIGVGIIFVVVEMMDRTTIEVVEVVVHPNFFFVEVVLIVEFDGVGVEVTVLFEQVE